VRGGAVATTVGDLLVKLSADTRDFDSKLNSAVGAGGPLGKIGVVAAAATAAAAAAVAGFVVKSVADFGQFDKGMREVFTLLPGITESAMGEMNASVLAFSREFGKLPDEVIPALYSALSAGVPPDNVFEFLEVANKAAVGGVTDLNTAVDGLTTVVNSYGSDVITVGEASDLMFTAVRLGKTTFEELSAAMFQVAPIASSLGVEFGEVMAAAAALTAQGVPTSVAMTQIRSVLAELSKEGGKAAKMFADISGQSFPDFIAGGGTVEQALQMMAATADEEGMRIADMFSRIEASNAATALTSQSGAAAFSAALAEMSDSAGATDAAFAVMDAGISASWDRLKAGFATLTIEVGEKFAPMFQDGVDFVVGTVMPALREGVLAAFEFIASTTEWLRGVWLSFQGDGEGIFATVGALVTAFAALVSAAFQLASDAWEYALKPAWEAMEPLALAVVSVLVPVIEAGFALITGVLTAFSAFLRGDFTGAWKAMVGTVEAVNDALARALEAIWTALVTLLEANLGRWRDYALAVWEALREGITGSTASLSDAVVGLWQGAVNTLTGFWRDVLAAASELWGGIAVAVGAGASAAVDALWNAWAGAIGFIANIWDGIKETVRGGVNALIESVNGLIRAWNGIEFRVPDIPIPSVTIPNPFGDDWELGGGRIPGASFRVPQVPEIPALAKGGIVTGPTLALIGEAGPEAVIPLDQYGGGTQTIIVELDGAVLTRAVAPRLVDQLRVRTGLAGT
jgi:TP901 family phage tail tape measure protein